MKQKESNGRGRKGKNTLPFYKKSPWKCKESREENNNITFQNFEPPLKRHKSENSPHDYGNTQNTQSNMACKFDPLSNCDDLNKELQKLLKKVESGMYNEEEFEHRFKEIQDRLLHCKDDFFEKEYFPKEKNSNFHQFRKAYLEKNRITHNTIIVQNLHPEVTEYLLYWLFNQTGKIDSVVIRSKNRNDRYSYIEYIDPENIDRAIEIMNDYPILDRKMEITKLEKPISREACSKLIIEGLEYIDISSQAVQSCIKISRELIYPCKRTEDGKFVLYFQDHEEASNTMKKNKYIIIQGAELEFYLEEPGEEIHSYQHLQSSDSNWGSENCSNRKDNKDLQKQRKIIQINCITDSPKQYLDKNNGNLSSGGISSNEDDGEVEIIVLMSENENEEFNLQNVVPNNEKKADEIESNSTIPSIQSSQNNDNNMDTQPDLIPQNPIPSLDEEQKADLQNEKKSPEYFLSDDKSLELDCGKHPDTPLSTSQNEENEDDCLLVIVDSHSNASESEAIIDFDDDVSMTPNSPDIYQNEQLAFQKPDSEKEDTFNLTKKRKTFDELLQLSKDLKRKSQNSKKSPKKREIKQIEILNEFDSDILSCRSNEEVNERKRKKEKKEYKRGSNSKGKRFSVEEEEEGEYGGYNNNAVIIISESSSDSDILSVPSRIRPSSSSQSDSIRSIDPQVLIKSNIIYLNSNNYPQ